MLGVSTKYILQQAAHLMYEEVTECWMFVLRFMAKNLMLCNRRWCIPHFISRCIVGSVQSGMELVEKRRVPVTCSSPSIWWRFLLDAISPHYDMWRVWCCIQKMCHISNISWKRVPRNPLLLDLKSYIYSMLINVVWIEFFNKNVS